MSVVLFCAAEGGTSPLGAIGYEALIILQLLSWLAQALPVICF